MTILIMKIYFYKYQKIEIKFKYLCKENLTSLCF